MTVKPPQGPGAPTLPPSSAESSVPPSAQAEITAAPQSLSDLVGPIQKWLTADQWGNEYGRRLGQSLLLLADSNPAVVGLALSKLTQDLSLSVDIVGWGNRVFFQTPVTFKQVVDGVLAVADASSYIFVKRQAMTVAMLLDPDRATAKALDILQDASQPGELRVAALEALDANRIRTTVDPAVITAMEDADVAVRTAAIQVASRFMFGQEGVFDKIVEVAFGEEGPPQQMALGRLVETIQGVQGNDGDWNAVVPKVVAKLEAVLTAPDCDMSESASGGRALDLAALLPHSDTAAMLERLHLQFAGDATIDGNSPYLTALLYMEDQAVPVIVRLSEQNKLSPSDSLSALLHVLRIGSGTGAWRAVAALLKHDSESVRVAAQGAILNRMGDFRAITAMLPYLDDPDANVQTFAREVFNSMLQSSRRFPIEVNRLCSMLASDVRVGDKTEAELAERALRLWGLAVVPHMQSWDATGNMSDATRAKLRVLMADITESEFSKAMGDLRAGKELPHDVALAMRSPAMEARVVPHLVDIVVSGDTAAAAQAAELLKQMGPHALQMLLEHQDHASPEVQARVHDVVERMGVAAMQSTGMRESTQIELRGPLTQAPLPLLALEVLFAAPTQGGDVFAVAAMAELVRHRDHPTVQEMADKVTDRMIEFGRMSIYEDAIQKFSFEMALRLNPRRAISELRPFMAGDHPQVAARNVWGALMVVDAVTMDELDVVQRALSQTDTPDVRQWGVTVIPSVSDQNHPKFLELKQTIVSMMQNGDDAAFKAAVKMGPVMIPDLLKIIQDDHALMQAPQEIPEGLKAWVNPDAQPIYMPGPAATKAAEALGRIQPVSIESARQLLQALSVYSLEEHVMRHWDVLPKMAPLLVEVAFGKIPSLQRGAALDILKQMDSNFPDQVPAALAVLDHWPTEGFPSAEAIVHSTPSWDAINWQHHLVDRSMDIVVPIVVADLLKGIINSDDASAGRAAQRLRKIGLPALSALRMAEQQAHSNTVLFRVQDLMREIVAPYLGPLLKRAPVFSDGSGILHGPHDVHVAALSIPQLVEAFKQTDSETARRNIAQALSHVGPSAMPALQQLLASGTESERGAALRALSDMGPAAVQAFSAQFEAAHGRGKSEAFDPFRNPARVLEMIRK